MRRIQLLIYAILTLAVGCAQAEWSMSAADRQAFEERVAAVAAEVNLHCARLTDATTLADVDAEAARHEVAMSEAMDALRDALRPLDQCEDTRSRSVPGLMDTLEEDTAEHEAELSTVDTLEDARAEGERYAAAVEVLLHSLRERWNTLSCL